MTMPRIRGPLPRLRAKTAAGGAARGVTLRLSEETASVQDPAFTIVPFDEAWGDSDFVSTTTLDSAEFGANAVPVGQAIVIPDGMPADSLYKISAEMGISPAMLSTIDGQWGLQFAIIRGDSESWPGLVGIQNVMYAPPASDVSGFVYLHCVVPRQVYPALLNPGDYFFAVGFAVGDTGGETQLVTGRATLTLTYWKTPTPPGS